MKNADNLQNIFTTQKAEILSLVSHVVKGCAHCGKGKCPTCGSDHDDSQQGNGQTGNNQAGNTNQNANTQQGNNQPGPDNEKPNVNINSNPTNDPAPQIVTAADMVQRMGSSLKHPVQINHDAAGVGVTHAAMLIHPEWNQGAIKEKVDGHLKASGWKASRSKDHGGKTYDKEGHKIHVANVGHHLIISGQNKKGTAATPYTQPEPQKKGKKNENISKSELLLETFQTEVNRTISFIDKASNKIKVMD